MVIATSRLAPKTRRPAGALWPCQAGWRFAFRDGAAAGQCYFAHWVINNFVTSQQHGVEVDSAEGYARLDEMRPASWPRDSNCWSQSITPRLIGGIARASAKSLPSGRGDFLYWRAASTALTVGGNSPPVRPYMICYRPPGAQPHWSKLTSRGMLGNFGNGHFRAVARPPRPEELTFGQEPNRHKWLLMTG